MTVSLIGRLRNRCVRREDVDFSRLLWIPDQDSRVSSHRFEKMILAHNTIAPRSLGKRLALSCDRNNGFCKREPIPCDINSVNLSFIHGLSFVRFNGCRGSRGDARRRSGDQGAQRETGRLTHLQDVQRSVGQLIIYSQRDRSRVKSAREVSVPA